jgi:hypothetical protein
LILSDFRWRHRPNIDHLTPLTATLLGIVERSSTGRAVTWLDLQSFVRIVNETARGRRCTRLLAGLASRPDT